MPPEPRPGTPLLVAMHGCTQNAALFSIGSGWARLAAELGVALLLPEQTTAGNQGLCFSWYDPDHNRAHNGEAAAIMATAAQVQTDHNLDPGPIYLTGLSAGAAMALALVSAYPGRIAGIAAMAGVPAGVALDVASGLNAMAGGLPSPEVLAKSLPPAPPPLSLWHGLADDRVHPDNAARLADAWRLAGGDVAAHLIPDLGHAMPIGREGKPSQHFVRGIVDAPRTVTDFFHWE